MSDLPPPQPLLGLTVVVTRPRQQGETTAKALREAGATVIELPLLEIVPVECEIAVNVLAQAYAAIFVSANAVEYGVPCLRKQGALPGNGLNSGALIAAIGHATTLALHEAGFADVVSPQQSIDSEGLLAMPQLQPAQVKGQHVVLVRGHSLTGGRKLIEETMRERGATVVTLECYERRGLIASPDQVEMLIKTMKSHFAVMALSVETLESLMKSFTGHEPLLESIALLVPHARVAAAAKVRGFGNVLEVPMSSDSLIPALQALKPRLVATTV